MSLGHRRSAHWLAPLPLTTMNRSARQTAGAGRQPSPAALVSSQPFGFHSIFVSNPNTLTHAPSSSHAHYLYYVFWSADTACSKLHRGAGAARKSKQQGWPRLALLAACCRWTGCLLGCLLACLSGCVITWSCWWSYNHAGGRRYFIPEHRLLVWRNHPPLRAVLADRHQPAGQHAHRALRVLARHSDWLTTGPTSVGACAFGHSTSSFCAAEHANNNSTTPTAGADPTGGTR